MHGVCDFASGVQCSRGAYPIAVLMLPKKASRTSSSSTRAAALESKRSSALHLLALSPPSAVAKQAHEHGVSQQNTAASTDCHYSACMWDQRSAAVHGIQEENSGASLKRADWHLLQLRWAPPSPAGPGLAPAAPSSAAWPPPPSRRSPRCCRAAPLRPSAPAARCPAPVHAPQQMLCSAQCCHQDAGQHCPA